MNSFKKYLNKLKNLKIKKSFLINIDEIDIKNKTSKNNNKIIKDKIVLLLSGSSNYKTSALSIEQKNFLKIFEKYGYKVINSNFPYNSDFEWKKDIEVPILLASISNIIYYFHTLFNKKFKDEIVRHLLPLCEISRDKIQNKEYLERQLKIKEFSDIIIIAQSSGLNILKILYEKGYILNDKTTIFALGPVAKGNKKISKKCIIFKGNKDIFSKFLDLHKCDVKIKSNHFDYLKNIEVKDYICNYIKNKI